VLGLEAAARGLVRPGTQALNLVQGVFGKGMGYWLKDFGAELHELEVPYNDAVDASDVELYLDEHPGIELVTVVHSETPSGTICDLAAIGPIAHARGALTLVDCVSSLGGIALHTDEWQLDVCVAGAQKCLAGPPGISLMTVGDAAWERIRANPQAPRASYLSMLDWKEQWIDGDKFPFTPSVSDVHGVEAACDELLEEGLEASIERHERSAAACRAGARAMAVDLWPRSDEIAAACVTAIAVPDPLTDVQVQAHCRERYGVMISGGQGAGNLVRIGHMGPSARSLHPVVGLAAVGQTLADLGVDVEIGAGLEAALSELSKASTPVAST
jgi:pyridoxamine--pyruvate transaminase